MNLLLLKQTLDNNPTLKGILIGLRLPNILNPETHNEFEDWEESIEAWNEKKFEIDDDLLYINDGEDNIIGISETRLHKHDIEFHLRDFGKLYFYYI